MRIYRNLKEVMEAKGLSREKANGMVGTKIFEVEMGGKEINRYVCMDDLVVFLVEKTGKIFEIERGKRNKKLTKTPNSCKNDNFAPSGNNLQNLLDSGLVKRGI